MSSPGRERVGLGDVDPAGSRHLGRRSAVLVSDERIVAGTADGTVIGYDHALNEVWRTTGSDGSIVALAATGDCLVAGERGSTGAVTGYGLSDGDRRFRYETATDLGDPQKETRFFLPFVADVVTAGGRFYVAARRYERADGARQFESVVYAFAADGTVDWRYETDASPIALDVHDDRLAVAYNRCPGAHQCGLVVLDAASGAAEITWDPGTDGQRRVGDVVLLDDGAVVASHGDYHGYRLDAAGGERWRTPLATPRSVDGESVYAYPNHVHATESGIAFVTGNTYPEEGRETDARHPHEHAIFGYAGDGERCWTAGVGGFASGIATADDCLAVPGAQNFRARDGDAHGLRLFDVVDGELGALDVDGVVTAAGLTDGLFAAVEEPVAYHDDDTVRGDYRLRVGSVD